MKQRTRSVGLPVKNMPPSTSDDTTPNTNCIVTLEEDGDDLILPIPEEILKTLSWNEGDMLKWSVNKGSITLEKAMTEPEKWNRGLDIFIESVIEPDPNLRAHAHEQQCFHELMWVRENVLEYLKTLRWKE